MKRAYAALQLTLDRCEALQRELSGRDEESTGCKGAGDGNSTAGPKPLIMGLQIVPPAGSSSSSSSPADSLSHLVKLHSSLKTSSLEARRCACRFEELVQRCLRYEELEAGHIPSDLELMSDLPDAGCCGRFRHALCRCNAVRSCWRRVESLWVRRLRRRALHYAAIACGLLSGVIVLGQLTMLSERVNLSVLSMFFLGDHGAVLTQVLCALPLSYMAFTAYWSVFRLKIAGWYGLYSNHNTDAGSLLWCSYSLARLALPLCYHFLLLIDRPPHFQTSFQDFMGQMRFVPILGHQLNQVFPCLVAFIVLCNVTKVYSRVVSCLGLPCWSSNGILNLKAKIQRPRVRNLSNESGENEKRSTPWSCSARVNPRAWQGRYL